jgi:GNAT superfamily N-acetyltransferase
MGNTPRKHLDDLIIRPATDADADAIGVLWGQLVEHHRRLDPALPRAADDGEARYADRICDSLSDSYARAIVAEHDGDVIGFVLGMIIDLVPVTFEPEMTGFLADIFVTPAYRGYGVGRTLVDALGEWFCSRGVETMEWYVAARNEDARAFWQAVGGRDVMVRMRVDL